MMDNPNCGECGNAYHFSLEKCPHCDHPNPVRPNVAQARAERAQLKARYEAAVAEAAARGAGDQIREFEVACSNGFVVINRSLEEVNQLAVSDRNLYCNYYQYTGAGIRIPEGNEWDVWRQIADNAFFPNYKERIRFGAWSLDGHGMDYYGPCTMVLKNQLISKRTTFFTENTVQHVLDKSVRELPDLAKGHRADWDHVGWLCVAKAGSKVEAHTEASQFPSFIMKGGDGSGNDEFIEAHIYGNLSINTLERVKIARATGRKAKKDRKVLEARLKKHGVELEEY